MAATLACLRWVCCPSPCDIAVLELSSFQLETTTSLKAKSATILNVVEDHMDRYDSLDRYALAKQRIYANAELGGVLPGR